MPLQNIDHFKAIYTTVVVALGLIIVTVIWQSFQITTNQRDISILSRGQIQLEKEETSQLGILHSLLNSRTKAEKERKELIAYQKELIAYQKEIISILRKSK